MVGQSFVHAFCTTAWHGKRKEHTARTSSTKVRSFSNGPSKPQFCAMTESWQGCFSLCVDLQSDFDGVGKGIAWSVENTASSLIRITDPFHQLLEAIPDTIAFSFHTCMFAAKRKKDTALWTSVAQLRTHPERKCDEKHTHLRWGKTATGFATAEECAYMICCAVHGPRPFLTTP